MSERLPFYLFTCPYYYYKFYATWRCSTYARNRFTGGTLSQWKQSLKVEFVPGVPNFSLLLVYNGVFAVWTDNTGGYFRWLYEEVKAARAYKQTQPQLLWKNNTIYPDLQKNIYFRPSVDQRFYHPIMRQISKCHIYSIYIYTHSYTCRENNFEPTKRKSTEGKSVRSQGVAVTVSAVQTQQQTKSSFVATPRELRVLVL